MAAAVHASRAVGWGRGGGGALIAAPSRMPAGCTVAIFKHPPSVGEAAGHVFPGKPTLQPGDGSGDLRANASSSPMHRVVGVGVGGLPVPAEAQGEQAEARGCTRENVRTVSARTAVWFNWMWVGVVGGWIHPSTI